MIARRKSRAPRMREAYPQLDIIRAMSALSRGDTLCLFYDERGRAHGLMEFAVAPDMSQVWLHGEIAVRNMAGWRGATSVTLVPNPNGVQRHRRGMSCPNCERRCQKLTWVGSWRCRACDGLLDRRQLVSPDTRRAEQLAELETQLAGGRRKGQHQAQFDKLKAQAEQLARELEGKRPRMAAPDHRLIVDSEWISIDEYRQRPSLQHLPVPSDDWRRPKGWFGKLEAERLQEVRTRDGAEPPEPAPKTARMSFEARAGRGNDPDEVSIDEM